MDDFEEIELNTWSDDGIKYYLFQLLNKEYTVEELREDLKSFRNTKHYTGSKPEFKELK
jgi:hypothetical protein